MSFRKLEVLSFLPFLDFEWALDFQVVAISLYTL